MEKLSRLTSEPGPEDKGLADQVDSEGNASGWPGPIYHEDTRIE